MTSSPQSSKSFDLQPLVHQVGKVIEGQLFGIQMKRAAEDRKILTE